VYSVFVVIVFIDLFRFLTIGIRALSFAKEGKKFFLFLHKFSREEKEGGTSSSDMKLYELNLEKQIGYLNSSRKIPNFKKTINRNGVGK
jgi:hypothetical protein